MYFRKGDEKMKKSKLSIGLVTSFIGALALTSCNATPAVTSDKDSIVNFIGYNKDTEKLEINIDEFYKEYGESAEGTTLFYNAVLESLIRYEYKALSDAHDTLKKYTALVKEADEKVDAQKQVAADNAKSNGTKFDAEWDKILESYDCETTEDLKQHFLYDLEKDAITDWYFKDNQAELMNQYLGIGSDWSSIEQGEDFSSVYPYHILHVLVKLGADASDYARATITAAEAEKLWRVVRKLMDGQYTFEEVAYGESEDSSNTAYGDVGIMSTQTSFYNEFKLGIYAYDALLSKVNAQDADNKLVYEAFGVDQDAVAVTEVKNVNGVKKEVTEKVTDLVKAQMVDKVKNAVTGYDSASPYANIPTIPYDVFRQMNELKDEEKINGKDVESSAVSYPRNVLFNQFLNFRSPFVITNEDIVIDSSTDQKVTTALHDFADKATEGNFYLDDDNFDFTFNTDGKVVKDTDKATLKQRILTDGKDNVIICVRSTAGIHFMVMRKSVFENTNVASGKSGVTLQQYYTTDTNVDDPTYPAQTYVNMTKSSDPSYYTNRANTIKSKLKGQDSSDTFDAAYDYRIYEKLINDDLVKNKIHFFDENNNHSTVAENILKKVELLREGKSYSNYLSIKEAWEGYLAQLRHQNTIRSYDNALVKTSCVFAWTSGNTAAFEKGGACYVK